MRLYSPKWHGRADYRKSLNYLFEQRNWRYAKVVAHVVASFKNGPLSIGSGATAFMRAVSYVSAEIEANDNIKKVSHPVFVYFGITGNQFWYFQTEADLVAARLAGLDIVRHKVIE